jgi:glycosyltransferase involved in cell wall biosynthesis
MNQNANQVPAVQRTPANGGMETSLVFAQEYELENLMAWSQIPANMRSNFGAILGAGFREEGGFYYPLQPLLRARALIYRKLFQRPFLSDRSPNRWRHLSKELQQRLQGYNGWVLMTGTAFLAFRPPDSTVLNAFWTDGTFRQFLDYWPSHRSIAPAFRKMGDDLEGRAIRNANLCVYSSAWAAESAIKDYGADPDKVMIAPFGPNLSAAMLAAADRSWSLPRTELSILSVGVDWSRKGMDIAVQVVSALRQRGMEIFLDIVGVLPPSGETVPAFVRLHGHLNKSDPVQQAKFTRLFETASAFILLSRADASPIVFSEAAAFGLPRFSFLTGGVGSVINDGVDGCLFDSGKNAAEMADRLHPFLADRERLTQMREATRRAYETRLNWPTQCKLILQRMKAIRESSRFSSLRS